MSVTKCVGIDPAPSKKTVAYIDSKFEEWDAAEVPREIVELTKKPVLIAWDAPIAFSTGSSYSDRFIDKAARNWCSSEVQEGSIEEGAVSVQPFSGCPHWALTCSALGLPFTRPTHQSANDEPGERQPLKIAEDCDVRGSAVVEVHPAVALACLWVDLGTGIP